MPSLKTMVATAIVAGAAGGCVSVQDGHVVCRDKQGTTHHVIVGFGVVRVNESNPGAAVVTSTDALGIAVTDQPGLKVGLGYSSSTVVAVPDGATNVLIETSKQPCGPLRVSVPAAPVSEPPKGGTP
ncbi:MAG: hypothetical protein HZA91_02310 [Verrucomicrobia bacterium]|nr:hypothetical protein [Verrucomicrobiota bacterium]